MATITEAIRKLFRIKRFASVEFSAKSAFENLDIAMILLQLFLFLAICFLLYGFSRWLKYSARRKRIRRLVLALHRLIDERVLMQNAKKLSEKERNRLNASYKESLAFTLSLVQKNGLSKTIGKHHQQMIVTTLSLLEKSDVAYEEQIVLIQKIIGMLKDI